MRCIALILLVYVSVLNITPAICSSYTTLAQTNLCINKKGCGDDDACSNTKQNENSNNTSPCTPCCYIQNCHCNIVNTPRFNFQILSDVSTEKISTENDKIYFNYLSDCWHPPKS